MSQLYPYPESRYAFVRNCLHPWMDDMRRRMNLRRVSAPTQEPITLAEAAQHLRLDAYGSPEEYVDQDLVLALIPAAREYIEFLSGRFLAPQVVELSGRGFPTMCCWDQDHGISLGVAPLKGIVSVSYLDGQGQAVTLADSDWYTDPGSGMPWIYPAYGTDWPSGREQPGAVRIRMNVGYDLPGGSPQDDPLPAALVAAMNLTLGALYENREEINVGNMVSRIPLGVQALVASCDPIRIPFA